MGISTEIGLEEAERGLRSDGRKPGRRGDAALHVLQVALLAAGATLLVVYAAAQVDAVRGRDRALEAFSAATSERSAATDSPAAPADAEPAPFDHASNPDQSLWGKARIASYRDSSGLHHDVPLGVLTIPAVRLVAPIFEGTSDLALNRGIGRIEGTAELGAASNVGLAGHRDGFFRPLKDVHVGDAIDVESRAGTTRYRITELSIVEPTEVHVLAPSEAATLTLVTCYPFYFVGEAPQRYIVRAAAEVPSAGGESRRR